MTSLSARPLVFLDVDGPLNPYAAKPERRPKGYQTFRMRPEAWSIAAKPLRVWLNPDHGPSLLALPADLVWATTWMAEANHFIAPELGLPQLPAVLWPEPRDKRNSQGLHWKTRALVTWAAGRPFAWIDDEITDADRTWVAEHHPASALLYYVDPRAGLTDTDFTVLHGWLRSLPPSSQ